MEYLCRAYYYTEARDDIDSFRNLYQGFREYNDVTDSVWKTLSWLYSNHVADEILLECLSPAN